MFLEPIHIESAKKGLDEARAELLIMERGFELEEQDPEELILIVGVLQDVARKIYLYTVVLRGAVVELLVSVEAALPAHTAEDDQVKLLNIKKAAEPIKASLEVSVGLLGIAQHKLVLIQSSVLIVELTRSLAQPSDRLQQLKATHASLSEIIAGLDLGEVSKRALELGMMPYSNYR